ALKDSQDNAVLGAASSLTAAAITVPNASLKTGGSWTDKGNGTYTATYTAAGAGTDLKATLTLNGWSTASQSAAYAITAGTVNQAKSTVALDNTTYVSGSDMVVTVALKDSQDNAVLGAASSLTAAAITVPNASLKTGGSWTDKGDGIYTATYTAAGVGTELKATLKLSDWSNDSKSAAYTITAGMAEQTHSTITLNKTTYVSGSDMVVTVALKDSNDNPVTGAQASLTASSVEVPNATLKAGSWTDKGDGTYTVTYTAAGAGTDLKATLTLDGWSTASQSAAYAITVGMADQAKSVVKLDKATYVSGSDMTVTVTLKDVGNNPVTGAEASLTAETVKVEHATLKTGSTWTDNKSGTYTATYTAKAPGTNLKATLKLDGWSENAESNAYVVTEPVAAIKDVKVNGHTFAKNDGFPTTGFKGAEFTLAISSGSASDYDWVSDAPWISVNDGVVRFTGEGTKNKVTLTGTPKSGVGEPIKYSFTLKSWFKSNGLAFISWSDAAAYCAVQPDYSQPTVQQLNGLVSVDQEGIGGTRGTLGGLWSEWGDLSQYKSSDIVGDSFWSSEHEKGDNYYYVYLNDGRTYSGSVKNYVVCRKSL
ncbi:invasin, partial [Enterobacterales bacterium CwR94]